MLDRFLMKLLLITFIISAAMHAEPGDNYEPNNSFSESYQIFFGDSVVKDAFVFGMGTNIADPLLFDIDYYMVKLETGKIVNFRLFSWDTGYFYGYIEFQLYDSSKSLIFTYHPEDSLGISYNVDKSGTYYIKISNWINDAGPQVHYGLSINQKNSGTITILSPDGGEIFSPAQKMSIKWLADTSFHEFYILQSCNNGKTWRGIQWTDNSDNTFSWKVPLLTSPAAGALVKVVAAGVENPPYDISNGNFTILQSTQDDYEPNNDFSSAYSITVGDNVVEDARIGEVDPLDKTIFEELFAVIPGDTISIADQLAFSAGNNGNDYYKVNLTADRLTKITLSKGISGSWSSSSPMMANVGVHLFDALKNEIPLSYDKTCSITQSGTYYIIVTTAPGSWANYSMSISQTDITGGIVLFSPNGGENFTAGQNVKVRWSAIKPIKSVNLFYSRDNGAAWNVLNYYNSLDSVWIVPPLKQRTDKVLIRIRSSVDSTVKAVSKNTFTIQAVTPDSYEPNNDFASAYPVAIGDSVVKNATISFYADVDGINYDDPDSHDRDYYKISLSAGKLTTINMFSMESSYFAFAGPSRPYLNICNDAKERVGRYADFYSQGKYNTKQTGIYYFEIIPGNIKRLVKYGLSISAATILSTQQSALDIANYQKNNKASGDSLQGDYIAHIVADTTQVTIDLTDDNKQSVILTTMVFSPDDFAFALNTEAKIKIISISYLFVRTVDITIPYTLPELNGNPENMLAAFWLDDTTNQWVSVPCTVDSGKHQITIHDKRWGTYGVFVKSNTANNLDLKMAMPVHGITMNYQPHQQSIAVHLSLAKATHAQLRLYNIQGKCVKSGSFAAGAGYSTFMWHLGALANGKYFLSMKAGTYNVKEPIVIMN